MRTSFDKHKTWLHKKSKLWTCVLCQSSMNWNLSLLSWWNTFVLQKKENGLVDSLFAKKAKTQSLIFSRSFCHFSFAQKRPKKVGQTNFLCIGIWPTWNMTLLTSLIDSGGSSAYWPWLPTLTNLPPLYRITKTTKLNQNIQKPIPCFQPFLNPVNLSFQRLWKTSVR